MGPTLKYQGESIKTLRWAGHISAKTNIKSSWDLTGFPNGIISGSNLPLYYTLT